MSELEITVLGCDGSYPSPGGACSSYLVRTPSTSLLIDAGTGSLANLQKHMAPKDLDAIILTHEHADHCANIADIRVLFFVGPDPVEGMPVYAAPGVKDHVFSRSNDFEKQLEWVELEDEDTLEIGDLNLRFSRTDHPVFTLAVRVDSAQRSFVYSADTGPNWSIDKLGTDIDMAFVEAAFPASGESAYHLSARQAGEAARKAGVPKLVLTHIRPQYDKNEMREEAQQTFGAPVEVAETGRTYEV